MPSPHTRSSRRILMLPAPAASHITPLLPVARELVARGAHVTLACTAEIVNQYSDDLAGLDIWTFPAVSRLRDLDPSDRRSRLVHLWLNTMDQALTVLPFLSERATSKEYDLCTVDPMALFGVLWTRSIGIPTLTVRSSFAATRRANPYACAQPAFDLGSTLTEGQRADLASASRRLHEIYNGPIPSAHSMFTANSDPTIMLIPAELQPMATELPDQFVYAGPAFEGEPPRFPIPSSATSLSSGNEMASIVYCALGDARRNSLTQLYEAVICAVQGSKLHLYAAAQSAAHGLLNNHAADPACTILTLADQPSFLSRASAFITHGGMGSVMEALHFGVPMILLPHTMEHMIIADLIAEQGLGLVVSDDPRDIGQALRQVLAEDSVIRRNCRHMARRIRTYGGYKRAADAVLEACPR